MNSLEKIQILSNASFQEFNFLCPGTSLYVALNALFQTSLSSLIHWSKTAGTQFTSSLFGNLKSYKS